VKLAILSDTHGLLRPELFPWLESVDRILHAGDIGSVDLLVELEAFAPVAAVWGNTDRFELRSRVPEVARRSWDGFEVTILHGHQLGMPTAERLVELHPEADLLVFGHTHVPEIHRIGQTVAVNPGSCGYRRGHLLPTFVLAELSPEGITTELIEIPETQP